MMPSYHHVILNFSFTKFYTFFSFNYRPQASSDFSVLDFDIPFTFASVLVSGVEIVSTICILASVTWQVFVVGIFATVASKYVQVRPGLPLFTFFINHHHTREFNILISPSETKGYYQATAQELMRINGTTKAPISNSASETALGVATIRAFKMSDRFLQNYLQLVDTDAKAFLFSNAAMEWFILCTETLQNLTLFATALLLLLRPKRDVVPGFCSRINALVD